MEIWIINPPFKEKTTREGRCAQKKNMWSSLWPPVSLAYIAAILREDGHEVKAFDCIASETDKDIFFRESNGSPRIAVVNTSTPTIESDLEFARDFKKKFPEATVIVFGTHPSALPNECLDSGADIAVIGEPENSIRIISRSIVSGSEEELDRASFAKKNPDGSISIFSGNAFSDCLDKMPFPAWDLFDLSKYLMPGKDLAPRKFLTITPSRGCPHNCSFCNAGSYYGKKPRFRDPDRVVDEIERNIREFGIKDFLIWTESFTMNPEFAEKICDGIINRGLKVNWVCNSRTDAASLPLFEKMKQAGCWMISFGVESGEQKILDLAKKSASVIDSEKAINLAKKAGLLTVSHVIIGLPGETRESVKKTWELLDRTKPDFAQFYCAVPFPGSRLYEEARRNNWIKQGSEFVDFEQMKSVMDLPTMKAEETMRLKNQSYLRYYLNVPRVFKVIRRASAKGIISAGKSAVALVFSEIKGQFKP
ncbi:MAG TPA: radical SAM protein [Candidatus Colwellbacteria bacterium]|nr:radical SAM protein [Candidatus Colwellbacteria bacterium]HQA96118.1 radical SAM protein [Candidatus Colwellbacteria bacterium]